ncbi:MAG TPA: hypothetical protein VHY56_00830 [Candidatus Binataceae bacterium]|nr:hypothetical protein [Candidatus Binataceae bacterium]
MQLDQSLPIFCGSTQLALALDCFSIGACNFQPGAYAYQQFAGGEGFDQVIIGSSRKSFHSRLFAGPCRKHNYWNVAGAWVIAQGAEQTEAVQQRHHHISQY